MMFTDVPRGTTRRTMVLGTTTAVVAALAGCRSAVGGEASNPSPQATRGGTATMVLNADAQPGVLFAPRAGNNPWVSNVFETLTRTDPESREPSGLLAQSWTTSEDGLTMDLVLRDDVTFHSGRAMTGDDVKFSFEKIADPTSAAQFASVAQQITNIDVTSPTQLTLRFTNPVPNIFDFFEGAPILDPETFAGLADGSQVIGTGPFTWSEWQPGSQLVLTRYDGYRDQDAALLDQIDLPVITDATAQVAAMRSNRAQIAGLTATDASAFTDQPGFSVESVAGNIFTFGMNVTTAPFDDKSVRQAVGFAIDRERINEQVMAGLGTPTDLFWSPTEAGYSQELAEQYSYDPDRAAQMIRDAGAEGAEVPVVLAAIPLWTGVYEILQNNLEAVGLRPVANSVNTTTFDQQQTAGDMGAAFINIHGQVGLSAATLINSTPALRPTNPSQFYPDEYASRRDALLAATDEETSSAALEALSEYMLDEAFTQPIMQGPNPMVIADTITGVRFTIRGNTLFTGASLTNR